MKELGSGYNEKREKRASGEKLQDARYSVGSRFPAGEYKATDAVRAVGPKVGTLFLMHNS